MSYRSQLALEFSGKATKLYQKHYGDDHTSTQRCLDLFTSIYAQVGKEEYTDKLSQYTTESADQSTSAGQWTGGGLGVDCGWSAGEVVCG